MDGKRETCSQEPARASLLVIAISIGIINKCSRREKERRRHSGKPADAIRHLCLPSGCNKGDKESEEQPISIARQINQTKQLHRQSH